MGPPTDRKAILEKLRKSIKDGNIIVGAGAGIGLSAKFIEQGGGDMIIIYNSGRFRMAGRGSLAGLMPYGNANDVVLDMVSNYIPKFVWIIANSWPGKRSSSCCEAYPCPGRCMRDRPVPRYGQIPEATQRPRFRGCSELPYSWAY